jgi:ribosome-associated toxin RatA of RatAB toxin-antitoxin module
MKHVHKQVLIWYSPAQMYALVTDVARYPEFLPWCSSACVIEQTPDGMTAQLGLSLAGVKQQFATRNTHVRDQKVGVELIDGPFSRLHGDWTFAPIGDGQACKVTLDLKYAFSSAALSALIGPVFDKVAATLVDAFVKRAEQVYGA